MDRAQLGVLTGCFWSYSIAAPITRVMRAL